MNGMPVTLDSTGYDNEYQAFLADAKAFWLSKAKLIQWHKQPSIALRNDDNDYPRWYPDGQLNTCYLCLDYQVEQGRGEQPALIYDSPVTGSKATLTYHQLLTRVSKFAGGLKALGVGKGDRVVIYMPMIPEAVIAMLACARLGAIHSVVFGGFAASELAVRIDDATPKTVLTASCGIEPGKVIAYKPLVDEAIAQATHKPEHVVLFNRLQLEEQLTSPNELSWQEVEASGTLTEPTWVNGTDPLYILYTSGTTGKPKGVVRDNGGHAVAMRYSMDTIYAVQPGDVYWAASDVGWVVGHSYIVYAPLLSGCTTILYEGKPVKTPDAGAFWRVCADYRVNVLFTAPTAFRAVRKEDPNAELLKQYPLPNLKRIYLAGERLDPPTYQWLADNCKLPVIDHWWQTETAWAIAGNPAGLALFPPKAGSATKSTPGFSVAILDDRGNPVAPNTTGNIAIKLPLPPGTLATIWQDHPRFTSGYLETYPGYYMTGDEGYLDEQDYLFVLGRCDDVINVAGHRLSTGQMEEVVGAHQAIAECAVIGMHDPLKGQIPIGLVILKDGVEVSEQQLSQEISDLVRHQIGAISCYHDTLIVARLPKTRSGKILRRIMRSIADGNPYNVPSTIDDPMILKEIEQAFVNFKRSS